MQAVPDSLRPLAARVHTRLRLASTTVDPIRSREVRPMLRRLELDRGDAVLDVGCAAGVWVEHVRRRVRRAVGIDPDAEAIAAGRWVYPRAELVVADSRALPFGDGEFDKVLFISTLEHIEQPEAALGEVARVLAPGGLLALSVDTLDHPAWRPAREVHARRSYVEQYFSRAEITTMAGACGLDLLWGRHLYGSRVAARLLAPRLAGSRLHWLAAPAVRAAGAALDAAESGLIYQCVMRRRPHAWAAGP